MDKIIELENFRNDRDKFESLFTILIVDQEVSKITEKLHERLGFLKAIKNNYKRKYLNDRLYSFIQFFEEYKPDDKITGIFLVGTAINKISLSKNHIDVIREYNIQQYIFKFGEYFYIDYINDLLTDLTFNNIIHVNGNTLEHIHLNSTKRKVINSISSKDLNILDCIAQLVKQEEYIIHGISGSLKNIKQEDIGNNIIIYGKHLLDGELLELVESNRMKKSHKKLEDCINMLKYEKTMDKVIVGKDIEKALVGFMVKTLFCTEQMFNKLNKLLPKENLNFEIVIIKRLESGDIYDTLEKDYRGIIGIYYY